MSPKKPPSVRLKERNQMPFIPSLEAEYVMAGTSVSVTPEALPKPPVKFAFKRVYIPRSAPKFDFAAFVFGESMSHREVDNSDILLCRYTGENFLPEKGNVVLVKAASIGRVDESAHPDWKCLRYVEDVNGDGGVEVSSYDSIGDEEIHSIIRKSDVVGIALTGFPSHALSEH